MEFQNGDIKILGRLVSIAVNNIIADASQIYDSNLEEDQETINSLISEIQQTVSDFPLGKGTARGSVITKDSYNAAGGKKSIAVGESLITTNDDEAAFGYYNVSHEQEETEGVVTAGGTQFSIGVGDAWERRNAFEVYDNAVYVGGVGDYNGKNAGTGNAAPLDVVIDTMQTDITNLQADVQKTVYVSEITNLNVAGQPVSLANIPASGALGTIDWTGFAASGCKILMLLLKDTGKFGEIPMTCYFYKHQTEDRILATSSIYDYDYISTQYAEPDGHVNVVGLIGSNQVTVYVSMVQK